MTLRDQMDAAWAKYAYDPDAPDREIFEDGFRAALAALANPSDEMVERCARAIAGSDSDDSWWEIDAHKYIPTVRAVLKAAGGE